MAGYDYEYTHKGNQNNWPAPQTKEWTKPSYDNPDHVCRPVILDSTGRKRPLIISYSPPNSHSPEGHYKEKIIEHIHYAATAPVIQEHKISQHTRPVVHQFKAHQHANDGNYIGDSHSKPVIHQYKVHPHADGGHYKDDTYARPVSHENKIHQHANGGHYKDDTYTRPVSHENIIHPHAKHDFPYVETYKEGNYTRPHVPHHSVHSHNDKNDHHHHIPHAKKDHGYDQYNFNKPSSPEASRPSGKKFELLSATHWRNMPHQHHGTREEGKLSGATNNIGDAILMLKKAAMPRIDSTDPARRYGSLSPPPRMYGGVYERHGPILSSREAAEK